jgi:hypothetical protein
LAGLAHAAPFGCCLTALKAFLRPLYTAEGCHFNPKTTSFFFFFCQMAQYAPVPNESSTEAKGLSKVFVRSQKPEEYTLRIWRREAEESENFSRRRYWKNESQFK